MDITALDPSLSTDEIHQHLQANIDKREAAGEKVTPTITTPTEAGEKAPAGKEQFKALRMKSSQELAGLDATNREILHALITGSFANTGKAVPPERLVEFEKSINAKYKDSIEGFVDMSPEEKLTALLDFLNRETKADDDLAQQKRRDKIMDAGIK